MARITVDDCLKIIPNRFDMTLAATSRARQLLNGATPAVDGDRDKAPVIALREMAAGKYGIEILARTRTSPAGAAPGENTNEAEWRRITETAGEAVKVKEVTA